jgi:DnaJ family protein C protein 3
MRPLALVSLLATLVVALHPIVVSADPAQAAALVENAKTLAAQGQYNEALAAYSEAHAKDPKNAMVLFRRAALNLQLGRSQAALDDFTAALDAKPDFDQALLQRGKLLLREGSFDEAEKDLKRYVSLHSSDEGAHKVLEELGQARSNLAAARTMLAKATTVEQMDAALMDLSEVISIAPQAVALRLLRAESYLKKGDKEMAIGDLVRITKLKPDSLTALQQLANIHLSLGEPEEALTHIKECLRVDPEQKECKATFRRLKKLEKALKQAKEAIEGHKWAKCMEILGKPGGSKGLIDEIAAMDSPRLLAQVYGMACSAQFGIKKDTDALVYCNKLLELDENNVEGLANRGDIHMEQEDYEAAMRDFQKAHQVDNQNRRVVEGFNKAQRLQKNASRKDYYKTLGVAKSANKKEIKKAFRKLGGFASGLAICLDVSDVLPFTLDRSIATMICLHRSLLTSSHYISSG